MSERPSVATLPSKYLPAVELRDLPEPVPLRKITGASVIILATALGSGEYILWPYITTQVGFTFLWAAILGFTIQFFLNMEIERYTLATGETVITGFTRLWRPWWLLFVLFALAQNFWPGWATGASTTVTFVFGLGEGAVVPITLAGLVAIGVALTLSPVVYQTVEKVQGVMVILILLFVVLAIPLATTGRAWGAVFTEGVGDIGFPLGHENLSVALLLGALAFAGAGGANNLVQSNYIRDKGLGMGQHIPRIVSPITGQEEARPSLGYLFPTDEANMRRWRGWWRIANWEQFITFLLVGVATLVVLTVLAYSTLQGVQVAEGDLGFLRLEGESLKQNIAPWFGTAFWLAGTVCLFSTNLGIIDYTCRLIADQLKINAFRHSEFWSESKIYTLFVWLMIVAGSAILLIGFDQPFILVVISSSIAGVQMFVYSGLLLRLNRRALPPPLKIGGIRFAVVALSFLFFGFLSVLLVLDNVSG